VVEFRDNTEQMMRKINHMRFANITGIIGIYYTKIKIYFNSGSHPLQCIIMYDETALRISICLKF